MKHLVLGENDIERLLAFSTIAQMGYIIFGLSVAFLPGLTGSLFHIMNHAVMKGLLFLCAGSFFRQVKTRDLRKLRGIGKTMPITSIFLAIGCLAMATVPPLAGFGSEWMILAASIEAEMTLFSALMLANMVFSVVYYLRVVRIVLLRSLRQHPRKQLRLRYPCSFPPSYSRSLHHNRGLSGPFIHMASQGARAALNPQAYIGALVQR